MKRYFNWGDEVWRLDLSAIPQNATLRNVVIIQSADGDKCSMVELELLERIPMYKTTDVPVCAPIAGKADE